MALDRAVRSLFLPILLGLAVAVAGCGSAGTTTSSSTGTTSTTTSLASSVSSVVSGVSFTLTATVTPSAASGTVTFYDSSAETGSVVELTLDSSSTWTVTGTSYLTSLSDSSGISGTTVSNIVGNGNTVYYLSSNNSSLGGLTYTLSGDGYLKPY